jgi:hypothetical protein
MNILKYNDKVVATNNIISVIGNMSSEIFNGIKQHPSKDIVLVQNRDYFLLTGKEVKGFNEENNVKDFTPNRLTLWTKEGVENIYKHYKGMYKDNINYILQTYFNEKKINSLKNEAPVYTLDYENVRYITIYNLSKLFECKESRIRDKLYRKYEYFKEHKDYKVISYDQCFTLEDIGVKGICVITREAVEKLNNLYFDKKFSDRIDYYFATNEKKIYLNDNSIKLDCKNDFENSIKNIEKELTVLKKIYTIIEGGYGNVKSNAK